MARTALLGLAAGARRKLLYHEEDGRTLVETRQDVAPIVAAAKRVAEAAPGADFRHAAFIPEAVLNQAFLEGWFHDAAAWKRWANDPANAAFRTWRGRL